MSVAITFASLNVHLLRPVSRLSSVGLVMPMREHICFFVLFGIANHSAALAVSLSILFTPSLYVSVYNFNKPIVVLNCVHARKTIYLTNISYCWLVQSAKTA